jgi:hypothetical protein
MLFRISLDPMRQIIVPGHWPATVFGEKGYIEREFESAELAVWEIGDEFGIAPAMLQAVPS